MKTTMGLFIIAIGAIFAFAVTTNTSVLNLHTMGFVLIIIGVLGMVLPRASYKWVSTQLIRRRRSRPIQVTETTYHPYRADQPGDQPVRAVLTTRPPDSTEVLEEDVYDVD
jgi:hypothetical protein